jgi:hypothetical protein
MKPIHRWAIALGTLAALCCAAVLALAWWLPSDEELARRIEAEVEQRSGVKVAVGSVNWRVLPYAALVAENVRTQQDQPITVRYLAIYPQLLPLLQRKVVIDRVDLEGAVIPRNSLRAFRGKSEKLREESGSGAVSLERFVFKDLTYISHSGIPVAYDGDFELDADWRPRVARVSRPGVKPAANLVATRQGNEDRWQLRIEVAGGTAHGVAAMKFSPDGAMALSGELAPRNIEVQQFLATFNRRSPLSGRASGRTVLEGRADSIGALGRSIHTQSVLTVEGGKILRLDLDKAVKSAGKDFQGETPLDQLSGQMDTQNTENGMRVTFTNVLAVSGNYKAVGSATIYQRQLDAEGKLDIAGGLVGVPFTAVGPVRKPKVTVPKGFFAGAAIGTAVLPGIGTVIGANIGGAMSRMFGGKPGDAASAPKAPLTRPLPPRPASPASRPR